MVDMLTQGDLDAVMTPFMPPHFFNIDSPFRMLFDDVVAQEAHWYERHRYVPGIHVMTVSAQTAQRYPSLTHELSILFNTSRQTWRRRRAKYMDTSPWFIGALINEGHYLDPDWNAWSLGRQRPMIEAFIHHQRNQGILTGATQVDDMFGH